MRVPFLRLAAAGLLALAFAMPVDAGGSKVEIVLYVDNGSETFEADGGFCSAGTALSSGFFFAGGGRAGTYHLVKTLDCADGSGTLVINVDAATANGAPQDQGGWSVIGGTGDWVGARGGGNLVGYFDRAVDIEDHYTGVIVR
jgi:hypothetical protein